MERDIFLRVRELYQKSEFIQGLQVEIPEGRPLEEKEIKLLESLGNYSPDWRGVRVAGEIEWDRVRGNIFLGEVILSNIVGKDPLPLPPGIYNSVISSSVLLGPLTLHRVSLLHNYILLPGVFILGAGEISFEEGSPMGNGVVLPLGIETGGREIRSFAEITVEIAEILTCLREEEILNQYEEFIKGYLERIKVLRGVIREGVRIINTPCIKNAFLGKGSWVENACKVENVTVLSNPEEVTEIKDGALVEDSILQWGCEVSSMGIVTESVLTEHSHVERHGKVTGSLIGPNTGVGEGEVTASLVGPFVGFHHQALLIAALWPEGKGNVGYGANVGSNHTSKAPDQEIWCGEGTFFGLGVNIKFPANFRKAPYSIIATGVTTLPQRVEFPFSLINTPSRVLPGVSPAFNEIIPGWVLSDNLFTVRRNEGKFKKRNKAKRTTFNFEVLRPEIVELMKEARERLQGVKEIKEFYLEKDIPGLGKNYLMEASRKKAIETYNFFIRYYALMGMLRKLRENMDRNLLDKEDHEDQRWEHERKIIREEFPERSLPELLDTLKEFQEKIAIMVEESKRKDDRRGRKIIDDYEKIHTLAQDDSFVKETWEETEKVKREIEEIKRHLSS